MKRNKHEWDFMGHDTETKEEYHCCCLCNGYRKMTREEYVKITEKEHNERYEAGKIIID